MAKETFRAVFGDLNDVDLKQLCDEVIEEIKERRRMQQRTASSKFHRGQTVRFDKDLRSITMKIETINDVTVSGVELDGQGKETNKKWRVAPTFLKVAA
jgi:hypothetical protein